MSLKAGLFGLRQFYRMRPKRRGIVPFQDPMNRRLASTAIDRDRTSALQALGIDADALLLLTDVPAVFRHCGSEDQTAICKATPETFEDIEFAPGSMGPKAGAAIAFVQASGKLAGIDQLTDARAIPEGWAGTRVLSDKAKSRRNNNPRPKTSGFTGADQPVSVWLDDGGAIV